MRLRLLTQAACLLCLCASLARAQIEVVKTATSKNPTLFLAKFTGDSAIRAQLLSDLRLSDWFDLVDGPADAQYLLEATYKPAGPDIELRLTTSDGNPVVRFLQPGAGNKPVWVVHMAVDALIQQVFKHPGFCRSMLAYVLMQGSTKEIYLAEFDGGSPRRLTFNNGLSVEPAWRVDGKQLLYMNYGVASTSVVLVDLTEQQQQRISWSPGLNSGAAFSHRGDMVALTLSRDNNVELYTLRLADRKLTRLTNTQGVEASPVWSPDDSAVCFVSDSASVRPTIYRMARNGGAAQRIIPGAGEAVSPDWSTVSNQLVYATRQGGQYVLAVLDMAGGKAPKVITNAAGDWESPSWAPDGRHVICMRTLSGRRQLMIVDTWYGKAQSLNITGGTPSSPTYSNPF